jgi:hypothetical protein
MAWAKVMELERQENELSPFSWWRPLHTLSLVNVNWIEMAQTARYINFCVLLPESHLLVGYWVSDTLKPKRRNISISFLHIAHVWWRGLKNSPTVTHACRKRRLKWVPSAWGYSWATLSPGVINTEAWSSRFGVGCWTNNPALNKSYCYTTTKGEARARIGL